MNLVLDGLTKEFRGRRVVDDLTVEIGAGRVTGLLGPNGAGKSTTLRMVVGLVRPTAGSALLDGRPYAELPDPRRAVGAALETTGFHPGRRGRDHLRVLARAGRIAESRVDEVIRLVELDGRAEDRVGDYSLGMRQRLALAGALLGDPQVLVLDEPNNGLDPGGVAWLRSLMRSLAEQGRIVLVSSHLLSEVERAVDDVVILRAGRLRYAGALGGLANARVPAEAGGHQPGSDLESAFLELVSEPVAGERS